MKILPIAIVGLNFGKYIIEDLSAGGRDTDKGFRIAAVCDLDAAKAEAMGRKLGVKAYTDLDALLADKEIPVIGLFTGPVDRSVLLRRIIQAGKDVMTTKPFDFEPDKAAAILREARRRRRIIHVNSPAPVLSPDLLQIVQWQEKYDLGRPIAARGDIWASYRETRDGSWYDDPQKCPVAPIFRLGIYFINDLIELFGSAESLQVSHSRIFTGRPTPDNAQMGITFRNGALANVFASFCIDDAQPYRSSLTLNFERGTIYRNVGAQVSLKDKLAELVLVTKAKSGRRLVVHKNASGISGGYQWRALYRAVTSRLLPPVSYDQAIVDGVRVLSVLNRAEESAATVRVE